MSILGPEACWAQKAHDHRWFPSIKGWSSSETRSVSHHRCVRRNAPEDIFRSSGDRPLETRRDPRRGQYSRSAKVASCSPARVQLKQRLKEELAQERKVLLSELAQRDMEIASLQEQLSIFPVQCDSFADRWERSPSRRAHRPHGSDICYVTPEFAVASAPSDQQRLVAELPSCAVVERSLSRTPSTRSTLAPRASSQPARLERRSLSRLPTWRPAIASPSETAHARNARGRSVRAHSVAQTLTRTPSRSDQPIQVEVEVVGASATPPLARFLPEADREINSYAVPDEKSSAMWSKPDARRQGRGQHAFWKRLDFRGPCIVGS